MKIFIDPGHGGKDSGATGFGLQEKHLTLQISKKIVSMLQAYENVSIRLSRTTDKNVSLRARTNMANNWGADFLLSVHVNAGGGTGYEDYIYNGPILKTTASIRATIHQAITKQIHDIRNRGKKRANFHMLRESNMPAMLTENLFIDHPSDSEKLTNQSYINKIATGHVHGIVNAFQLKKKSTKQNEKEQTNAINGTNSKSSNNKTDRHKREQSTERKNSNDTTHITNPPIDKNIFYRVIAGSFNDRRNADRRLEKLKQLGIDGLFIDRFHKK